MIKFKYDNIRTYTATKTYKATIALFRTVELILNEKFKFSMSADEYIGKVMEKEVDDATKSESN